MKKAAIFCIIFLLLILSNLAFAAPSRNNKVIDIDIIKYNPFENKTETEEWTAFKTILYGDFALIEDIDTRLHLQYKYDKDIVNEKSLWRYVLVDFNNDGIDELFVQYDSKIRTDSALFYYQAETKKVVCDFSDTNNMNDYFLPLKDGRLLFVFYYTGITNKYIYRLDSDFNDLPEEKSYLVVEVDYEYNGKSYWDDRLRGLEERGHEGFNGEGDYYFYYNANGSPIPLSKTEWQEIDKEIEALLFLDSEWQYCSDLESTGIKPVRIEITVG